MPLFQKACNEGGSEAEKLERLGKLMDESQASCRYAGTTRCPPAGHLSTSVLCRRVREAQDVIGLSRLSGVLESESYDHPTARQHPGC